MLTAYLDERARVSAEWRTDEDTAALLNGLRRPSVVPESARDRSPHRWREDIARLILDGVLELETGDRYVSGPAALDALAPSPTAETPADRLVELSSRALRLAARVPVTEPTVLAARLYNYNRLPLSPRWARRLPDSASTLGILGLGMGATCARTLARYWSGPSGPDSRAYWIAWTPRLAPQQSDGTGLCYKLYVSPHPDDLREALETTVAILSDLGPVAFKVGTGAVGAVRPDKLVVYFGDIGSLLDVAAELERPLARVRPHGVPFTAELFGGGLLSWGADPLPRTGAAGPSPGDSWRGWVTSRLAAYMLSARYAQRAASDPVRFATVRLSLDGVNTSKWAPELPLWEP